jgi:hypothetical protein
MCTGEEPIACPLAIDVLIDRRELWRPTSTGRLINRVSPASRGHEFRTAPAVPALSGARL